MYIIKLISRPTPFYFIVVKPYLQLELTEEPTPYNIIKYKKLTRINKPISLF